MIMLNIDNYCNNCNEFDADVEKDIVVLHNDDKNLNQVCKCNTTITCKHRFRCQSISGYLDSQKNDESRNKKIGYLIKKCSEDNGLSVIVCPNKIFCDSIINIAKRQKYNIPTPITFREFIGGEYNPDITKFYFDEIQISVQNLACGREINTVVIGGIDDGSDDTILLKGDNSYGTSNN